MPSGVKQTSGDTLKRRLAKLNIHRQADLLLHLPLRYEDRTRLCPFNALKPGQAWHVEGTIVATEIHYRPRRNLLCQIEQGAAQLVLRFFHFYPSQAKALTVGKRVRAYGDVRAGHFGLEMIHPSYRVIAAHEPLPDRLTPVYSTTAGLSQELLRSLVRRALQDCAIELNDLLPTSVRHQYQLAGYAESIDYLHEPPPDASLSSLQERTHLAWQRIKFDELLAQQLSLKSYRRERQSLTAPRLIGHGKLCKALLSGLPFRLTQAQRRVVAEIQFDIAQSKPMHRLLQGDVGSGKTIVAALAALQCIESGYQVALMAPTEVLAEQHYRKLAAWLNGQQVNLVWLIGAQSAKARTAASKACASGEAQLIIGTHALFQKGIKLSKLGLAIVDEQHRFGVAQRLALRNRGDERNEVHQLMMSATPIPRTLAMSYYADLDVSLLDQMPPGRSPVNTKLISEHRRNQVIARVRTIVASGEQVFWVCPLIEESEKLQLKTALDTYELLKFELAGTRVALLHGRMKSDEKASVMQALQNHEIDVLVATTVIEVGVDVPHATLIVIEHAERYGLAQLHQLRGRVGRGHQEGACILLYGEPLTQTAKARLKVIYENHDGFAIAREDLRIRGPGEFLGARQSGMPLLRFADLEKDSVLLEQARDAADELLRSDPQAAEALIDRWLGGRQELIKA